MCEEARRAEIARLNDAFRCAGGGPIVLTVGISDLPDQTKEVILAAVRDVYDENEDGERRIGTLTVEGHEVLWYILYHCDSDDGEEPDPANPHTGRVLVIMLEGEP